MDGQDSAAGGSVMGWSNMRWKLASVLKAIEVDVSSTAAPCGPNILESISENKGLLLMWLILSIQFILASTGNIWKWEKVASVLHCLVTVLGSCCCWCERRDLKRMEELVLLVAAESWLIKAFDWERSGLIRVFKWWLVTKGFPGLVWWVWDSNNGVWFSSSTGAKDDLEGDKTEAAAAAATLFFFSPVLWNILQITHSSCTPFHAYIYRQNFSG